MARPGAGTRWPRTLPADLPTTTTTPGATRLRLLHGFIATLAPLDRALLLLYLEERSTREMADVLGISDSNVTTRLSRLRQRLREHAALQGHH